MDWEQRSRSNGKYLCRSVRINGRVSKQYIGRSADPVVQLIAKTDALSKAESAAAVDEVRCEQSGFAQLEPALTALAARVEAAITARATRGKAMKGKTERQPRSRGNTEQPTRELLQHFVGRADRGDKDAANQLCRMLRQHPEIWRKVGDLGKHVEQSMIDLIAAGNRVLGESLHLKTVELRASLAGNEDDALLGLLIDHVVCGWLECQLARMAAIQPQQNKGDARFWQQRHERANDRYLAAIEKLASIRQLLSSGSDDVVPIAGAVKGAGGD